MTSKGYARLSNGYWQDKDVLKLRRRNPAAALLHVLAISWCSDHATDGRIDEDTLLYVLGANEEDLNDLIASGMLQHLPDEDGDLYVLRSYLKYQNSSEQIEQAKTAATERQRRKRERDRDASAPAADNRTVTPVSDDGHTIVTDMSRRDNRTVTPVSDDGHTIVTDMSRRDNRTVTPVSFNQEPITNNQEESSNEDSLPQTPSRREGVTQSADEEYPTDFEQFWATYPRKEGKRKALAAWRKAKRKTNHTFLVAKASLYAADPNREPGYTLTPANWLTGEHWLDDPLPAKPKPGQPDPATEHARQLTDIDWLCAHVDDTEAQDAALLLPDKAQAAARARYPDEWYRLWRRGKQRADQKRREQATR